MKPKLNLSPIAPPTEPAELWIFCNGIKALLRDCLEVQVYTEGTADSRARLAHGTSIELPYPCTLQDGWVLLAICLQLHLAVDGEGAAAAVTGRRAIPSLILLHARACRGPAGELGAEWKVPELPAVLVAEETAGMILLADGPADLRLTISSEAALPVAGTVAEVDGPPSGEGPAPAGGGGGAGTRRATVGRIWRGNDLFPSLRLAGSWLGRLGFVEGQVVGVTTEPRRITLDLVSRPTARRARGSRSRRRASGPGR